MEEKNKKRTRKEKIKTRNEVRARVFMHSRRCGETTWATLGLSQLDLLRRNALSTVHTPYLVSAAALISGLNCTVITAPT